MRERPGCDREVLKKGMRDSPQGLKGKKDLKIVSKVRRRNGGVKGLEEVREAAIHDVEHDA